VNKLFFILAVLLSLLGIFVQLIFGFENATNQLFFLIISATIFLAISRLEADIILNLSKPLSVIGILLLVFLFMIDPIRGARRWFVLFGFNLQPSVVFFPFFLLYLSMFLNKHGDKTLALFIKIFFALLVPVVLVFKQPDLGTAVVLFVSLAAPLYLANFPWRYYAGIGLISVPLLMTSFAFLKKYQLERIISFINPNFDPSGVNYNSLQSVIAIGSGFIFGKGFNTATQSKLMFLPEAHTDFAFATLVEAFGFLGGLLALSVMFYFFYLLLREAGNQKYSSIYRYYIFGTFTYFVVQSTFNVGMNLRLLPVVGVPLPFISYGGSSLLGNFVLLSLASKLKELS
jgi:rod shape determining protein RodA